MSRDQQGNRSASERAQLKKVAGLLQAALGVQTIIIVAHDGSDEALVAVQSGRTPDEVEQLLRKVAAHFAHGGGLPELREDYARFEAEQLVERARRGGGL